MVLANVAMIEKLSCREKESIEDIATQYKKHVMPRQVTAPPIMFGSMDKEPAVESDDDDLLSNDEGDNQAWRRLVTDVGSFSAYPEDPEDVGFTNGRRVSFCQEDVGAASSADEEQALDENEDVSSQHCPEQEQVQSQFLPAYDPSQWCMMPDPNGEFLVPLHMLNGMPCGYPAMQPMAPMPASEMQCLTIMMRNLPNKYTQKRLGEEIAAAGFDGTYDFLYLPIDQWTNANKGYAFINFVTTEHSSRFKARFEGTQMQWFNSNKLVTISPASLQGFEANYAHYSGCRCNTRDPAARPLFLRAPSGKKKPLGQRQKAPLGQRQAKRQGACEQAAKSGDRTEEVELNFCPACGSRARAGAKFCCKCGGAFPCA